MTLKEMPAQNNEFEMFDKVKTASSGEGNQNEKIIMEVDRSYIKKNPSIAK